MKKSIFALACGAFTCGAAEFVMMGVLTNAAHSTHVSIPTAGHYVSMYAIGVCFGALILVFGRRIRPKYLIISFMILAALGDLISAVAPGYFILLAGRFIAGLPHGAFFGTATIVAEKLADPGKRAQSVAMMVTGQTVANMVGVPAGTLLGAYLSWRLAFGVLVVWALFTSVLVLAWVPDVEPIKDAGIKGQFTFLASPKPWMVLSAVILGNTGIFCWWSYVSPWLQKEGEYSTTAIPVLMALAGFGMVIGGLTAGKVADRFSPGITAAGGQLIAFVALVLIAVVSGNAFNTALFTFICAVGMFFVSAPQQLLMVELSRGGGEMLASALVQVAYNAGNALGAIIGGWALTRFAMHYPSVAAVGSPITIIAVILLVVFALLYERNKPSAIERMEIVEI